MGQRTHAALGLGGLGAAAASVAGVFAGGPSVVDLAREFGFPIAALCVLVWCLIHVGKWMATKVVEPLVSSHTRLVNRLEQNDNRTTEAISRLEETSQRLTETLEQHHSILLLLLARTAPSESEEKVKSP